METRITMSPAVEDRRRKATARAMLRIIAAEQAHGIHRPDAEQFKARMEAQAEGRA